MRRVSLHLSVSLGLLAATACTAATRETNETASAASSTDPFELLELTCGNSDANGLKVDVAKYSASSFHVYVGSEDLFCFGPGMSHTSSIGTCGTAGHGWFVTVDQTANGFSVSANENGGKPTRLACTRPPRPDAPMPTYDDVATPIRQACAGCHNDEFGSLDRIKEARRLMLEMIVPGYMPGDNPDWRNGTKGQLVLDYLRHSPELN